MKAKVLPLNILRKEEMNCIEPSIELAHCWNCNQETNHHFPEDKSFRKCCKCGTKTGDKQSE